MLNLRNRFICKVKKIIEKEEAHWRRNFYSNIRDESDESDNESMK